MKRTSRVFCSGPQSKEVKEAAPRAVQRSSCAAPFSLGKRLGGCGRQQIGDDSAISHALQAQEYHRAQNLYEATLWAKDEECFHQVLISAMPSKAHAVEHNYNNSYDYSTYNS